MSYRAIVAYERQGKIIHGAFIMAAIVLGALATIILTTAGRLPEFKIFIPNKLPENHYLQAILYQRELFPFYIHLMTLTSISYLILRLVNFFWQKISLSQVEREVNESLKFTEKMTEFKSNLDHDSLLRYFYNIRRKLSGGNRYNWANLVSSARRRLFAVFEGTNNLSAENILLVSDTASSVDHTQVYYGYRLVGFMARLIVLAGVVGTIMGLAILAAPVISGDMEINMAVSHISENLSMAGYSIMVGVFLYVFISFSRHLDERYLAHLDNFLVMEIVQKIPFKNPDSLILLKTYLRTLRSIEKSIDDQLKKLNDRIDHLIKISR